MESCTGIFEKKFGQKAPEPKTIKKLELFNPLQRSISVSSNACTHFKYTKNLQTNTPWDVPTLLTPSPSVSGTDMFSKTPGNSI